MSAAVLKSLSIAGFWLVVMLICPMPLYSRFFNPDVVTTGDAAAVALSKRAVAQRAKLAETICSLANSLSGGLFLALGLIHLLPEAAESFSEIYGEETVDKYRPAFASAFVSYTLLLIIQRVIFGAHGHSHGSHDEEANDHHHHHHHDNAASSSSAVAGVSTYGGTATTADSTCELRDRTDTAPFLGDEGRSSQMGQSTGGSRRPSVVIGDTDGSIGRARSSIHASTRRSDVLVSIVLDHAPPDEAPAGESGDTSAVGYRLAPVGDVKATKVVTSIVLMLAFALHGFAEGMALGVQEDADSVGLMIIAIAMHKWAEAMSIGLSFQRSGMPKRYCMVYIVAFSLSTPLGIGIGWASEVLLPEAITAYLMAFSTGTFLYLGASDAIVEEFSHGAGGSVARRWLKLLFYLAGAVLIFMISVYFDHDHDGSDGHDGAASS